MLELNNLTILLFNSLIFFVGTILVLYKGRTVTNILFASSTMIISINSLILGIAFVNSSYQYLLFPIGTAIFILSPLGYFFAGKYLRFGSSRWNDIDALILIYVVLVGSLSSLIFYQVPEFQLNNFDSIYSDFIIVIGLSFSLYQFFKLYLIVDTKKVNFALIMSGFLIALAGIFLNLTNLILVGENTIFRFLLPSIGSILVYLAFLKT